MNIKHPRDPGPIDDGAVRCGTKNTAKLIESHRADIYLGLVRPFASRPNATAGGLRSRLIGRRAIGPWECSFPLPPASV